MLWRAARETEVDWFDQHGKSYDAVGGFPGRFFDKQWKQFSRRILDHLDKADLVPVDVSQFSADQIRRVREFIAPLGPKVFIVEK